MLLLLFWCLAILLLVSSEASHACVRQFSHGNFLGWAMSAMGSRNSFCLPLSINISYELDTDVFAILCICTCVSGIHSLLYSGTVCTREAYSQH